MIRKSFADNEAVYFTADLHFGHRAMCSRGWRPYSDPDAMDLELIHNWNITVGPRDHIFILGDFSFRNSSRTMEIIGELNGYKYLILGNHDCNLPAYAHDYFEFVAPYHEIKARRHFFTLCHFPMRSWNRMQYGSWNLHGHTHGNIVERWRRQVDVGVDNWNFAPVSIDTILSYPQPDLLPFCDHHEPKAQKVCGYCGSTRCLHEEK